MSSLAQIAQRQSAAPNSGHARHVATPRGHRSAFAPQSSGAGAPRRRPLVPLTPALKAYALWRGRQLDRLDPAAAQERVLGRLVTTAQDTRFGRDHGFSRIRSIADYQAAVPLRTYNELWEGYWKDGFPFIDDSTWPGRTRYFAVSSGTTTGKVKHIPCTDAMLRANVYGTLDSFVHHLRARPQSRAFHGKTFALGGSTSLVDHGEGIRSGDISGIAAVEKPAWTRPYYFPSLPLTLMTDWEEKIDRLAVASLEEEIGVLTGAPGWLLILFEKLAALKPHTAGRAVDIFPELELLIHGGVSFKPYKQRFDSLFAGSNADFREVYAASEGMIASADRRPGEGMRLIADNGLFYEFVPVEELGSANPTRHWLGTVEPGVDYAIVLTTCAGLWSYLIGDVVRFTDTARGRLLITGRTSYMLSSFGEHLTGELLERCVIAAAAESGITLSEFAVGTQVAQAQGALGRHVYVIEPTQPATPQAARRFAEAVDRLLADANEDYRERRAIAVGIQEPRVQMAEPGTFSRWMKARGRLGGQNKVPRVISDRALLEHLLRFVAERELVPA